MKKLGASIVVLLALTACALVAPAFAAGNVTFQSEAEGFVFEPGSSASPTDLFDSFKDLLPGDSVSDSVTVANAATSGATVKVYLRATGAEAGSEEFLSQLSLTVSQDSATLFNAPADQTSDLTDWVLLGTLEPGGSADLNMTLDVPITLGNDFQDTIGYLGWQFMVEEVEDDEPSSSDDPEDDDDPDDNSSSNPDPSSSDDPDDDDDDDSSSSSTSSSARPSPTPTARTAGGGTTSGSAGSTTTAKTADEAPLALLGLFAVASAASLAVAGRKLRDSR